MTEHPDPLPAIRARQLQRHYVCTHCNRVHTREALKFSGGLHCLFCDEVSEIPSEVYWVTEADAHLRTLEDTVTRLTAARDEAQKERDETLTWKQKQLSFLLAAAVEVLCAGCKRVDLLDCIKELIARAEAAEAHLQILRSSLEGLRDQWLKAADAMEYSIDPHVYTMGETELRGCADALTALLPQPAQETP